MKDLDFAKPLDEEILLNLTKFSKIWYIFSDSAKIGGIGEILSSFLQKKGIKDVKIISFEYEDDFIKHGDVNSVEKFLGIDEATIINFILKK